MQGGEFPIDFLHLGLYPADRRNFNFAIRRNVEKRGNVGKAIGVGDRVVVRVVVDGDRERYPILTCEGPGISGRVLTDAEKCDARSWVSFGHALVEGKSELADRTADLEEGKHDGTASQKVMQIDFLSIRGGQSKTGCEFAGYECGHQRVPPVKFLCFRLSCQCSSRRREFPKNLAGQAGQRQFLPLLAGEPARVALEIVY